MVLRVPLPPRPPARPPTHTILSNVAGGMAGVAGFLIKAVVLVRLKRVDVRFNALR
jgi:hypothetical protein